jgi:type II secretory pathway component PulK
MSRRGFALLAVLWALTAVTVLTGATVAVARLGSATTRNRVLLARAGWAREACAEILQARWASPPDPLSAMRRGGTTTSIDSVDLGRGTWCSATLDDPSAKLNLNLADRPALVTVLQAIVHRSAAVDSLADALLDWRDSDAVPRPLGDESSGNRNGPFADVWELRYVRGFTDSLVARLALLLTTRGTGAINVNAAPREVLAALPGITEETVRIIIMHRGSAPPLSNADVLAGLLSPSARRTLLASYPEFVRAAVFTPPQLVGVVTGGVRGTPLVARVTLTLVPVAGRLAVIRRETE